MTRFLYQPSPWRLNSHHPHLLLPPPLLPQNQPAPPPKTKTSRPPRPSPLHPRRHNAAPSPTMGRPPQRLEISHNHRTHNRFRAPDLCIYLLAMETRRRCQYPEKNHGAEECVFCGCDGVLRARECAAYCLLFAYVVPSHTGSFSGSEWNQVFAYGVGEFCWGDFVWWSWFVSIPSILERD